MTNGKNTDHWEYQIRPREHDVLYPGQLCHHCSGAFWADDEYLSFVAGCKIRIHLDCWESWSRKFWDYISGFNAFVCQHQHYRRGSRTMCGFYLSRVADWIYEEGPLDLPDYSVAFMTPSIFRNLDRRARAARADANLRWNQILAGTLRGRA